MRARKHMPDVGSSPGAPRQGLSQRLLSHPIILCKLLASLNKTGFHAVIASDRPELLWNDNDDEVSP